MLQEPSAQMSLQQQNELLSLIEAARQKFAYCVAKQMFDFTAGAVLGVITLPACLIIGALIYAEDGGSVIYSQKRIGQFGRPFYIHKFRTMKGRGGTLTTKQDPRITKVGSFLRKYRLDELPQIINLLKCEISLVGSRPEHQDFVKSYDKFMLATLLMPVGITSEASIRFRNESELLEVSDPQRFYKELILPIKAKQNLDYIKNSSFKKDIKILLKTVDCVLNQ